MSVIARRLKADAAISGSMQEIAAHQALALTEFHS
jgi:hypothetical protein